MATFRDNCPHCGTNSVAFEIKAERSPGAQYQFLWDTFAVCGKCRRAVLATFTMQTGKFPPSTILNGQVNESIVGPVLSPSPPDTEAPEYTPDNVARFYMQGMENLTRNWDAAGMMFRKALDTGLKRKFPDLGGGLKARIDRAVVDGKLVSELGDWAHQVRLGGNDAAHEGEPFSQEEAERLHTFTRLVFLYLFTLPGMLVEARRSEAGAEEQE